MENADAERFPAHVHGLAAAMTLQGAVAHCDMPVESGPTEYLPHSHKYEHGYLAYRDDFADYFKNNYVHNSLSKGDAVFFNPALLHAAGDNKSESIDRVGNLLQLSSAFGRSMETRTELRVSLSVLEYAVRTFDEHLENVIMATAEGYSFPTNLDFDQPTGQAASRKKALARCDKLKVFIWSFIEPRSARGDVRVIKKFLCLKCFSTVVVMMIAKGRQSIKCRRGNEFENCMLLGTNDDKSTGVVKRMS